MIYLDVCHYGRISDRRLDTAHPDLQRLFREVIRRVSEDRDLSIACGYRGEEAQMEALQDGKSDKRWPESDHNVKPSRAVDAWPYPVAWDAEGVKRFHYLRAVVELVARELGIELKPMISWDPGHYALAETNR